MSEKEKPLHSDPESKAAAPADPELQSFLLDSTLFIP